MFSKLHDRLGTAGLVVAIVALIAALGGTAFAAAGLNGKQKKEVKKIAKQFAGKNGAPGAPGAPGAKGDKGDAGTNGTNGTNGTDGTDGTNGKSVVIGTATAGECPDGGKTVEVEGSGVKNKVCNGADGETGFTETLTSEKTEVGSWAFGPASTPFTFVPVTWSIPLEADLGEEDVHFINSAGKEVIYDIETEEVEEVTPTECLGNAGAPTAEPGNLCVYAGATSGGTIMASTLIFDPALPFLLAPELAGAGTAGARLVALGAGNASGWGTFAVTAP